MKSKITAILALAAAVIGLGAGTAEAQGPREGIKVHGHWVIDVRNPDGTLAQHQEFENALTDGGKAILADLLTGRLTDTPSWSIYLDGVPSSLSPCRPPNGPSWIRCEIYPITNPLLPDFFNIARTLRVVVSGSTVKLVGSATAFQNGTVNKVDTNILDRGFTQAWGVGADVNHPGTFQPVTVVAGQIIQVTVTISFS